jgi:uncharacterized protein (DUF983 family)
MFLRCQCPGCGETKEYIAEQVGGHLDCFGCGHRLVLNDNPGRVTWHIVSATLAVLVVLGGIATRYYLRSHRWDRDRPRTTATYTFDFGGDADSDDDH